MGTEFWIRRFLFVYLAALAIITGAQLLKGRPFDYAIEHGLLWSLITAGVYLSGLAYRSRHCTDCRDTPKGGRVTDSI